MNAPLLCVRELRKHYPVTAGVIRMREVGSVKAVDGVSFAISKAETVSLVGESGCGKSTTAKCVLRVENPTSGSVQFDGKDIARLSAPERKWFSRSVQAVFQDPFSSLNPRMRVKHIIGEPLVVHETLSRAQRESRVCELLEMVGLPADAATLYPHEFSGGQRQRIAIARALALDPRLVVLDEPVSALDVSVRAQVTNLLQDLQEKLGVSYLLIAHDLAIVQHMSNTVYVMYLGKVVETAQSKELYRNPRHPYTTALLSAALPYDPAQPRDEIILGGEVPSPLDPPPGCRFHPRCPRAMARCSEVEPQLKDMAPGHQVACHLF
jgi:oligopeptide/dipeptide ABC transporter ATP-binding protein